ncbi:MAG: pyruvate kinase [Proteobacteria bacterium]|nr:pyruvate kinase [Pseudomonadota bacterium]
MSVNLENSAHTKIVWSFSSQVLDSDLAKRIADEKVSAVRLVYHGDSEDRIPKFIDDYYKSHNTSLRNQAAIMVDLSEGARAQITGLTDVVDCQHGEKFKFIHKRDASNKNEIAVQVRYWDGLFREGAQVYIGYGLVVLKVLEIGKDFVSLEVVQGGQIFPDSEIHIPETRAKRTLASFDKNLLQKLVDRRVSYFVLPGITDPNEIKAFRDHLLTLSKDPPWLILRVDSKKVYENLDSLIETVEGLLISRRELALTTSPATIPMVTKEIIQKSNNYAKFVVTASEMLGSMRRGPTPTRAEVSDIANAIHDGSDALMLSEEVTHGRFGVRALGVMHNVIEDTEKQHISELNWMKLSPDIETEMDAVAFNAYKTAERVRAKAIVCMTKSGNTALRLSSYQPPVPIIAVTFQKDVANRLNIVRGVQAVVLDSDPEIGQVLPHVNDKLIKDSWLKPGDKIVFISVTLSPVSMKGSNLFTVQQLQ